MSDFDIFVGNREGSKSKCPTCGYEYYACREIHFCDGISPEKMMLDKMTKELKRQQKRRKAGK